jgi:Cu+-exporting ATPase
MLYDFLPEMKSVAITDFEEITGKGIRAKIQGIEVIIGSAAFAGSPDENTVLQTAVHITINEYITEVCFNNQYREGLESLQSLKDNIKSKCCPEITRGEIFFRNTITSGTELFLIKAGAKLEFIKQLQEQGRNVMMVGDG